MAGKMRRSSKEILLAPHGLYDVHEMLGQGGIGTVWLATYKNNGRQVALKLGDPFKRSIPEKMAMEDTLAYHQQEWEFYRRLRDLRVQLPGLPRAYEYGVMQREHDGRLCLQPYMSMQLLGPSIASLFELRNFRKPNFFDTANRMLTAVESFHRCGLVHRDVKPVYGAQTTSASGRVVHKHEVYLVDYGFAKAYDPRAEPAEFELFGGTPDYSSTSQLNECTTGPADDLESLVYAFLWILSHGHLPWDCHRDLKKPKTPYSEGVLRQMVHVRTKALEKEVKAGRIPAWLRRWQGLAQSYESTEQLAEEDYARFRNILAQGRAGRECGAEE